MTRQWRIKPRFVLRDAWAMVTESLLFLNPSNVGNPFVHGERLKRVFHLASLIAIAALHGWILNWVVRLFIPSNAPSSQKCGTFPTFLLVFVAIGTYCFVFVASWVNVHIRLKPVVLGQRLRLPPALVSEKYQKRYKSGDILSVMKQVLELVQKGDVDELTELLKSSYGQGFLLDAAHRVRRLRLRRGRMVRREKWKMLLLNSVVSLCWWVAVGGARVRVDSCDAAEWCLEFLEIITITLLTLVAVSNFFGCPEYINLMSESLSNNPLTQDEKILISLLASCTTTAFNGFRRTQTYANIKEEGDIDALLPMHGICRVYIDSNQDASQNAHVTFSV